MLKAVAARLQGLKAEPEANKNGDAPPPDMVNMDEIVEGTARILHPKGAVFYNPAQVVNRDLSVLVLRNFARRQEHPIRILEALSATGLRSIRYFNEVPNVSRVLANDFDKNAVATIERTVRHNGLDPETQVVPNQGDAAAVMAAAASACNPESATPFDVIDLDPYGSAAPFIEPAIRSIADGGLLAVTCTDLAVLCGKHPEKCYARYGGAPLNGPTMHEVAVRLVLSSLQAAANRLDRAIEPVLCARIDFYVRVFVRVRHSKLLGQQTPSNTAIVFQCVECKTQRLQHMGRARTVPVANKRRKRRKAEADAKQTDAKGSVDGKTTKPDNEPADAAANGAVNKDTNGVTEGEKTGTTVVNAAGDGDKEEERTTVKYQVAMAEENISCKCSICGGSMHIGGPMWTGPLVGEGVAEELLKNLEENPKNLNAKPRVQALIKLLGEEVRTVPLFMNLPTMCQVLKSSSPPAPSVRTALMKKGYKVSQSHTEPGAIKTDAPPELLWDILRLWVKKNGSPLLEKKCEEGRPSAGQVILSKEPELITAEEVDFSVKKDKFMRRGTDSSQTVRYPQNPEPNWGPKARAGKRKRAQES